MLKNSSDVLERLFKVIESRKGTSSDLSYTAHLFDAGTPEIAKKVGEEAVETVAEVAVPFVIIALVSCILPSGPPIPLKLLNTLESDTVN